MRDAMDELSAHFLRVPLVGNIVASEPLVAMEDAYEYDDVVEVSTSMISWQNGRFVCFTRQRGFND